MRIFCATLIHETNSFSPIPTSLKSFQESFLYCPSSGEGIEHKTKPAPEMNLCQLIEARGHTAIEGLICAAEPSRPCTTECYEHLKDEIIRNLTAALPVNAVALFLHGAMLSEASDDCEADLLAAIRSVVGAEVTIGIELDLHGHISPAMTEAANLILSCQEYPHTDFDTVMEKLITGICDLAEGRLKPNHYLQRVPMLGSFFTTRETMRALVDHAKDLENTPDIYAVNIMHGFAWADTAESSASVLVYGEGDFETTKATCLKLANALFEYRDEISLPLLDTSAAIDLAEASSQYPIVIADTTDNPGGGAPGDSTYLLREALARNLHDLAIALIWDPAAVRIATAAGVGAWIKLRVGGKTCELSGEPLDLRVRVSMLKSDAVQRVDSEALPLGDAALLEFSGVKIIINSIRQQTFSPDCFTEFGIDPGQQKYLIFKSHQHFHALFSPIAGDIIYATPPGVVNRNYSELNYSKLKRPVWPLDAPPFDAYSVSWR